MRDLSYQDEARLVYGRMLWKKTATRERLIRHWTDRRHPYRDRFLILRPLLENILETNESNEVIDARLRQQATSLRALVKEIPPVFGSFY